MRTPRILIAALTAGLLGGGAARAGVYNLNELPPTRWPNNFQEVHLVLDPLRAGIDDSLRQGFQRQVDALNRKRPDQWTTLDRVNLGGCYIRLGRPDAAIEVLTAGDQSHFMILANLAAAYHAGGQLDRAVASEEEALRAWPDLWAGWGTDQLTFYRRVERYYLKLLRLRRAEEERNPGGKGQWQTVDALFDRVRYVGPGGKYEAGAIEAKSRDELPPDAFQIVMQLLLWLPDDSRLYWQLGEILNAFGYVGDAYAIMDELVYIRKIPAEELGQHRRVLLEVKEGYEVLRQEFRNPSVVYDLMWHVYPRGVLTAPGLGDAAAECGLVTTLRWSQGEFPPPPPPDVAAPAPPRGWFPDWQAAFFGFAAGSILTILGALQWMEWRRRRQAAAFRLPPPPGGGASAAPAPTEAVVHDPAAVPRAGAVTDRVEGAP